MARLSAKFVLVAQPPNSISESALPRDWERAEPASTSELKAAVNQKKVDPRHDLAQFLTR